MIELREIEETIEKIKSKGNSIEDARTLAMMYVARDYMMREMHAQGAENYAYANEPQTVKETPARIQTHGTSRFLAACNGVEMGKALEVLDRHMEVILVLYPKEYDAIVRQLESLRE